MSWSYFLGPALPAPGLPPGFLWGPINGLEDEAVVELLEEGVLLLLDDDGTDEEGGRLLEVVVVLDELDPLKFMLGTTSPAPLPLLPGKVL